MVKFTGYLTSVLLSVAVVFLGVVLSLGVGVPPGAAGPIGPMPLQFNFWWIFALSFAGVALYMVWVEDDREFHGSLIYVYFATMVSLMFWFFAVWGLRNPLWSLVVMMIAVFFSIMTNIFMFVESKKFGYLFLPFMVWLLYVMWANIGLVAFVL